MGPTLSHEQNEIIHIYSLYMYCKIRFIFSIDQSRALPYISSHSLTIPSLDETLIRSHPDDSWPGQATLDPDTDQDGLGGVEEASWVQGDKSRR